MSASLNIHPHRPKQYQIGVYRLSDRNEVYNRVGELKNFYSMNDAHVEGSYRYNANGRLWYSGKPPLKEPTPCTSYHSPVLCRIKKCNMHSRNLATSPNLTQREAKASLNLASASTTYRDTVRPWLKRDGALEHTVGSRLYNNPHHRVTTDVTRPYFARSQTASLFDNTSNSSYGLSKYINIKPLNGPVAHTAMSTTLEVGGIPNGEFSNLTVEDSNCHASSSSPVIKDTDTRLSFLSTKPHISAPSVSDLCSSGRSSPDASKTPVTSNSSNNCSAPRWSNTSRPNQSTEIHTRTGMLGDRRGSGLVGLNNLGSTCFMNSIIQCLSNTHPLLEYCLSGRYVGDLNSSSTMRGSLFASYVSLMRELWNPDLTESSISPHQFKTQIQKFAPRFVGYSQQDSQEFLRYVLEGLHLEVNRVTKRPHPVTPDYAAEDKLADREKAEIYWRRYLSMDNSEIVDLFVGQLMSTLECSECGFKSTTFDPFWDLSLPIPKRPNVTIMDCLRLFTSKDDLDGNERPVCGRCKVRRRCAKNFSIQKFPRILVLHLKRFSGERFRSKMSVLVDYPLVDLDLSEFASPSCQQRRLRYNLYAVSNHSGSVYAGHYTSTCKNHYRNSWLEYNDSRVRPTATQSIVSAEGYVLFYELIE